MIITTYFGHLFSPTSLQLLLVCSYLSPTVALFNTSAFLGNGDSLLEMSLLCSLSSLQLQNI
jgi:hypothetical protein